jgi:hypothetical protein
MTVVHLDPWTDIVNVNWGGTTTHVAFYVDCSTVDDSAGAQTYRKLHDLVECFEDAAAGGEGSGNLSISATLEYMRVDVTLQSLRYIRRKTGPSTYSWHSSTPDKVGITFGGTEGALPPRREYTQEYELWEQAAPVGDHTGFIPRAAADTGIPTPGLAGTFDARSTADLQFYAPTVTGAPGCVYDELEMTGNQIIVGNDDPLVAAAHQENVLDGVTVLFEGRPCTIIGTYTATVNTDYTNSNLGTQTINRPKTLGVLARVDGAE